MSNKYAMIDTETAINDYQRKHPDENNPTVIITSKKNVFGRMERNIILGSKNNWRGIIKNIRRKRETFISVEISPGDRIIIDRILGNVYG